MKRLVVVALVLLIGVVTAWARTGAGPGPLPPERYIVIFGGTSSASGSTPGCSNKLDFTQACNSQYMGIF